LKFDQVDQEQAYGAAQNGHRNQANENDTMAQNIDARTLNGTVNNELPKVNDYNITEFPASYP